MDARRALQEMATRGQVEVTGAGSVPADALPTFGLASLVEVGEVAELAKKKSVLPSFSAPSFSTAAFSAPSFSMTSSKKPAPAPAGATAAASAPAAAQVTPLPESAAEVPVPAAEAPASTPAPSSSSSSSSSSFFGSLSAASSKYAFASTRPKAAVPDPASVEGYLALRQLTAFAPAIKTFGVTNVKVPPSPPPLPLH